MKRMEKIIEKNLLMYISIIAMVGIFLLMLGNVDKGTTNQPSTEINSNQKVEAAFNNNMTELSYEEKTEKRLEDILSSIAGVGKVKVFLTIKQGSECIYGNNTSNSYSNTEEKDNSGGIRSIKDTSESIDIVTLNKNGEEVPLIKMEKSPIIKGAIVVAQGATDPLVRDQLHLAVSKVLGVALYDISVLPSE